MQSVVYAEGCLCLVLFVLSVVYADVLFMLSVVYANVLFMLIVVYAEGCLC